jgi:hypothetical protein
VDGSYLIDATREYILAFEAELGISDEAEKVEMAMKKRYPQRWNEYLLERSCASSVRTA